MGKGFLTDTMAARRPRPRSSARGSRTSSSAPTRCTVQVVTAVLIVLMSATTFFTQRQLMSKNMPADAMDNPFAQQQKILLYVFPLLFAVSGVNFPIGVLLYWLTTNVWSMGQQFYVIRRMPSPGSPAAEALERRKAAKAARQQAPGAPAPGPKTPRDRRRRAGPRPARPARAAEGAQGARRPPPRPGHARPASADRRDRRTTPE